MTPNDLAQMQQAYNAYIELYEEHKDIMIKRSMQILREIRAKYDTLFEAPQYHGQHRWLFFTDWVNIEQADGEFIAEFWERGRCGDNDDLGHVISADYLVDSDKMKEYVEQWTASVTNDLNKTAAQAELKRLQQIEELERQLAKLKFEK